MLKRLEKLEAKKAKLQSELFQIGKELEQSIWVCGKRERGHRFIFNPHADYQECVDCGTAIIVCQHCQKPIRGKAEAIDGAKK